MEEVSKVVAIKRFMERADRFAPAGGRPVTMDELRALTAAGGTQELAKLAAAELGVTLAGKVE